MQVFHRLPINLMLSSMHIKFRVTAKNQDVPLDKKNIIKPLSVLDRQVKFPLYYSGYL